jgi:methylthioxylose transferase
MCCLVSTQQLWFGDPAAGWVYPYVATFSTPAFGAAVLVSAMLAALILLLPDPNPRNEWLLVSVWILVGFALQGVLRSLAPHSMHEIFLSDDANAFYRVTQLTDARSVLSDFAVARPNWPLHAQSNMPGKIMLIFGLKMLSADPTVLPWLIVALSSAGGALLYIFVRDLFADREVGLFSLMLYLFVPARVFFLPLLNTVTPVILLVLACLVLRWLQTGNQWYAAAAGLAVYGLVFFEPLPLVMGVLFAGLIVRALVRRELAPSRLATDLIAGALGFTVAYLALRLWLDFDLVDAVQSVAAHAVEFNTNAGRPYAYWLRSNLREFIFGMGLCQAVLFMLALVYLLREAHKNPTVLGSPIAVLTATLTLILVTTDVIGINRGEVIRLWIFLACFFQIPAAYLCARLGTRAAILVVVSLTVLHTAIAAAMIGFVVLA